MKHSLKISSLIIFAATVASAFTSCGNDSELFDEPVVYQTRAMTRAGMGVEVGGIDVIRDDGINVELTVVLADSIGTATTYLNWNAGSAPSSTFPTSPIKCIINLHDTDKYSVKENKRDGRAHFHDGKPRVIYDIEINEKGRTTPHKFRDTEFIGEPVPLVFKPHGAVTITTQSTSIINSDSLTIQNQ